jgi:hypothetical protein
MSEMGLTDKQRRILTITAASVAVIVSAVVLTLLVGRLGDDETETSRGRLSAGVPLGEARPAAYRSWPSLEQFRPIDDRKADPKPMAEDEFFGAKTVRNGRITLRLAGRSLDTRCADALWGAELLDLVARSGCTQALRGLYTSADGRYVAQYTLLNLSDVKAANALVEALESGHRGGWARSLPPPATRRDAPEDTARDAPEDTAQGASDGAARGTAFPIGGHSEAGGHAMGHYVGLVWYGRTDGAEPGTGDDFVTLGLAVRSAEKAVFRRVVAAGTPAG